ncbi:MAG: hypothetical protein AAGA56_16035 [Myxococcota bacterium]
MKAADDLEEGPPAVSETKAWVQSPPGAPMNDGVAEPRHTVLVARPNGETCGSPVPEGVVEVSTLAAFPPEASEWSPLDCVVMWLEPQDWMREVELIPEVWSIPIVFLASPDSEPTPHLAEEGEPRVVLSAWSDERVWETIGGLCKGRQRRTEEKQGGDELGHGSTRLADVVIELSVEGRPATVHIFFPSGERGRIDIKDGLLTHVDFRGVPGHHALSHLLAMRTPAEVWIGPLLARGPVTLVDSSSPSPSSRLMESSQPTMRPPPPARDERASLIARAKAAAASLPGAQSAGMTVAFAFDGQPLVELRQDDAAPGTADVLAEALASRCRWTAFDCDWALGYAPWGLVGVLPVRESAVRGALLVVPSVDRYGMLARVFAAVRTLHEVLAEGVTGGGERATTSSASAAQASTADDLLCRELLREMDPDVLSDVGFWHRDRRLGYASSAPELDGRHNALAVVDMARCIATLAEPAPRSARAASASSLEGEGAICRKGAALLFARVIAGKDQTLSASGPYTAEGLGLAFARFRKLVARGERLLSEADQDTK